MNPLFHVILASTLAGFASMAIAYFGTSRLKATWQTRLVSFAAGLMLALALLDLLPTALEDGLPAETMFRWLLVVLIALFALDHRLHSGHRHQPDGACSHDLSRPVPLILAAGAFHVFTDGVLLGAAFQADIMLAWLMAVIILAHEVPREAGDFAVLFVAKWDRHKALKWNALTRLACVVGAVGGYLALNDYGQWIPYVLTIAAANFIYIALTGIIPWLRREHQKDFLWQGGLIVLGALLVHLGEIYLH